MTTMIANSTILEFLGSEADELMGLKAKVDKSQMDHIVLLSTSSKFNQIMLCNVQEAWNHK